MKQVAGLIPARKRLRAMHSVGSYKNLSLRLTPSLCRSSYALRVVLFHAHINLRSFNMPSENTGSKSSPSKTDDSKSSSQKGSDASKTNANQSKSDNSRSSTGGEKKTMPSSKN